MTKELIKVNILTMKKKAQITLFMILGLFVIIIFLLLWYITSLQIQTETKTEQEELALSALQSRTVKKFAASCLEQSSSQGLILIGRQGGYIYAGQPASPFIGDEYIKTTEGSKNITYLILPKKIQQPPPHYPCTAHCEFVMGTTFPQLKRFSFGRFRVLPILEKNTFSLKTGEQIYIPNSIQEQLESYIKNQTIACINITELTTRPELSGAEITAEPMTVNVIFGDREVFVEAIYPLNIIFQTKTPISYIWKFNTILPVRFRKIYESVDDMIQKDIVYLDYDILKDTQTGFYKSSFYNEEKELPFNALRPEAMITLFPLSLRPEDDIIIINDSASKINGKPYVFQFARRNRRPVLDYIPSIPLMTRSIEVKAHDPDEDTISYTIKNQPPEMQINPNGVLSWLTTTPTNIIINASDGFKYDYQEVSII